MSGFAVTLLDNAQEELGGFLPRLGGALVLLIVGLLVAALSGPLARPRARGRGGDTLAEQWGVARVLERAGLGRSLSKLVISVGDVRGRIESIETAATVLRTEEGTVRVPNNMLLGSVVTAHEADSG